jgi:O-antigen ligase
MKLFLGVFAFGVGISLLLLSDNAKQSITSGIKEIENSSVQIESTRMGDRVIMWEKTLQMAPQYVFLGAGLAGFSRAFDDNWKLNDGIEWRGLSDPHNQYLKIVIELGLPGLAVFLLFLTKIISSALALGCSQRIGLGVLFAWCATSFFSAHFTTFHEGHFIWLFIGIFLSGGKPNRLAR